MIRPNVILVLCDQMRGDCLGADGHPVVQTPNLDYLAACGTRFVHAYTAVPSCLPARASIWTGQDQWHAGILGMGRGQGPIPNDYAHTLAGELSRAGTGPIWWARATFIRSERPWDSRAASWTSRGGR